MRLLFLAPLAASTLALNCLTAQSDSAERAVVKGVVRDTLGRPARRAIVQLLTDQIAPTAIAGQVHPLSIGHPVRLDR